jgi:hypothetical protein
MELSLNTAGGAAQPGKTDVRLHGDYTRDAGRDKIGLNLRDG